jgi:hypothetical protein
MEFVALGVGGESPVGNIKFMLQKVLSLLCSVLQLEIQKFPFVAILKNHISQ